MPRGVAGWQAGEPRIRPAPRKQGRRQAGKRQPRTATRLNRRGPPLRKERLPEDETEVDESGNGSSTGESSRYGGSSRGTSTPGPWAAHAHGGGADRPEA